MKVKDGIEALLELLARQGQRSYQENVTQLDHALQAAALAESEGASAALVTAALLHDVGHLLEGDEGAALHGIDDRHEVHGSSYLAQWFGAEVTRPIRLHVDAKRYLCAVEPDYAANLSEASVRSLALQGGPFDPEAAERFLRQPHAADAVRLRRWDEGAKQVGAAPPPLEHFRRYLDAALAERGGES
ncbi:MAG: HD domain-containing protein [Alphaproteobacteria bacterium]